MITSYDEYISVNNEFYKQIPHNWSIFKLKYLIDTLESGKREDFDNTTFALSLGGEHINWDGTLNLTNKRYISEGFYNSMNKGKIQKNDVLLVKDGATIGKTAFVDDLIQKMAVNEHVFIIRSNKTLNPKLLYYLISSHAGFTQIKLTETGSAQGGINQDILDKVEFTIPQDLNHQETIVNFLDANIDKIDKTIAKNKQLINLLEEKKVSLINKVVTNGLNPNALMIDSGIEWIGEIPAHWAINKLSYYFKQLKNKNMSGSENNLLSLSYGKIIRKNIESNEGLLPENFDTYNIVDKDDIVLRLTDLQNDKKSLRTGLVTEKGIITSAYVTIRPINPKINIRYIYYLLHSYDLTKVFYNMGGGVRQNLNYKELSYLECLEPPYEEQVEIANYLDIELSKIESLINKLNKHNVLCEEYKSSLIHHVVTGKIDVTSGR